MPSYSRQLSQFNQVVTFANSNNNLVIANSIIFTDGSSLNTALGLSSSSGSYANSAFLQANTPSHVANSAASYANSAFAKANTGTTGANSFGVIYTANNNTFANATTANDTLTIVGESGTVVYANATTKTITVAGTPGAQGLTVDYGFVNDPIYYSIDYGTLA